ncbi:MAG: hypothetical protein ABR507_07920, partial [Actinomycetota bacterium]
PANDQATTTTTVNTSADLQLTKSNSPDPVVAGTTLTYTFTVTNLGPSRNAAYQVSDTLPAQVTFISASPTCNAVGQTVTCGSSGLDSGSSEVFTVTTLVSASTPTGTVISNQASIVSNPTPDPNPGNDTATSTANVVTSSDLAITKSGSPNPTVAGSNVTYTVVVTNLGPSASAGFEVSDPIPAGSSFFSVSPSSSCISGSTVTCTASSLAVGASVTYTLVTTIDSSYSLGSITNTATISSETTPDPNSSNNSASSVLPVSTSADLSITKTASPDPVIAGNVVTYTVTVTNNGPSDNQGFTVTDTVPANTTLQSSSTSCTQPPAVSITCSSGPLASGSSKTFLIATRVSQSFTGAVITNTAFIASTLTSDPNPANDQATTTTTVNTSADLQLTKADSPDPVVAGNTLTYTLTITNNGPSDAGSFSVTDTVPSGTTFLSAPGCSQLGGVITCSAPSLGASSSVAFTVSVIVDPNVATGTVISNTAVISSESTTDPDLTNNSATATTDVNESAVLSVTKSGSPSSVAAGQSVTYTATVSNAGPSNADNTTLVDALPSGLSMVSASPGCSGSTTVTCAVGTLVPGQSATVTITASVNASAPAGTVTNTVTADSSEPEGPVTATATTTITQRADLSIVKTDSSDPAAVIGNITYTVVVTNLGPSDNQGFSVTDAIPANTTFVSATSPDCAFASGSVTCTASSLGAGQSVSYTVVVRVDTGVSDGTVISNTASVNATAPNDNISSNNSSTTTTTVSAPTLSITKSAVPASGSNVSPGQTLIFTVTFMNSGSAAATGFVVTDTVDTSLGSVSVGNGGTFDPITRVITWNVGTVGPGATGTVSFTAVPGSSSTTQQVKNRASSIADQLTSAIVSNQTIHTLQPPDLLVTKSADRAQDSQVKAFQQITYTLIATNNGNGSALSAVLFDTAPQYLNYVAGSTRLDGVPVADVGGTSALFGAGLSLGTLPAKSSRVVTLAMTVDTTAKAGALLENRATLTCSLCTSSSVDFFRLVVFKPTSGPSLQQSILVQGASGTVLFVTVFNEVLGRALGVGVLPITGVEYILLILLALSAVGLGKALTLKLTPELSRISSHKDSTDNKISEEAHTPGEKEQDGR